VSIIGLEKASSQNTTSLGKVFKAGRNDIIREEATVLWQ